MIFIAYLIKDQYAIWSGFKWNEPAVKNTMVNFIQQIDFQGGWIVWAQARKLAPAVNYRLT